MSVKSKVQDELIELKTSNRKILEFYNKHKNIDFVQMNEIMIDLFEKVIININGELTSSLTKELIETMHNIGKEMTTMKDTVDKSNKEVINSILLKMYEQKSEFMNDIKLIIDKSDNENLLKIIDKMDKEQQKIINEIIPKSNTEYYRNYELLLREFKNEIKNTDQLNIIENKHSEMIRNIELSLLNNAHKSEERLQNNINEIKTINIINSEIQKETNTNLTTYLNKFNNSSLKGQIAENNVEELLCSMYKSSEIIRKSKESKTGDMILKRVNMEPILFEVKDFKLNVPIIDIDKFIRDVNECNMSGIMLSISSGVANKHNYQIDITKDNNICIYIHNVEYDIEKIRLAVDIIDNLGSKLKENKKNITITTDIIEQINNDYQTFLLKRDLTLNHIKESTKKTIQYIEELELKNLNNYLSTKFSFKNSSTLKCNLCNNFIGTNLKSIAAHKRKCKGNKTTDDISSDDISADLSADLLTDISANILTDMSADMSADISADMSVDISTDILTDMPKEKKIKSKNKK
jgi:hypothetical protein